MDPNANLIELRKLINRMNEAWDADQDAPTEEAFRMSELIEALDGWISRGGFLPDVWRNGMGKYSGRKSAGG